MPNYTNSVTRNLNEKLGEFPSALDFSAASIDDGATDATSALQAGLDSVASRGGGALLVPPGTYQISGAGLAIPAGVYLYGHGETSCLRRGGTLDVGRALINFDGVSNAGVEDLYLEGDVTTPVPLTYAAFSSDPMDPLLTQDTTVWIHGSSSNILLQGNTFRHSGGYSILGDSDDAAVTGVEIRANLFENCYPHTFGTDTASSSFGAWTGGVFFQGACTGTSTFPCKDVTITGNTFRRVTGNNIWMHSNGFDAHHQNFHITGNTIEDCGLDAILLGNLQGGECSGNVIHRAGYVTVDDVIDSTPLYPGYTYAVGIDCSGYVADVGIKDNTITSVLGGFIDLDGFRSGSVEGNRLALPASGTLEYTRDGIAGYASGLPAGINLGNTSLNGGAADINISDNEIIGCKTGAIRGNFAKRCHFTNNRIEHPTAATEVPIYLFALDSGAEYWSFDNVVSGNQIRYNGPNFCIAEVGDTAAYGSSSATNTIFPNHIQGTSLGEFLKDGSSATRSAVRFSGADSTLTARSENILTRSTNALQFYKVLGTASSYIGQLGDTPGLNISLGTASSGRITTGLRVSAGTMEDFIFTGKSIADGFTMLGGQTFLDADANQFDEAYGLMRYVEGTTGTGTFQLSKSTNTAGRVWEDLTFGSATSPGADTEVLFNDAGAFGAVPTFTYDKVAAVLTLQASGTATYGDPILRVLRADLSEASMFEWSGNIITTNAAFIACDASGNARASIDGNPVVPYGIRVSSDASISWANSAYAFDTRDLGLNRDAAGIAAITDGQATPAYRDLRLRNLAAFGTAADSIQSTGGFTGITFISTRTDGDDGVVWSRASGAWGARVDASGYLNLYDRTNSLTRLQLLNNGQTVIPGLAAQAALSLTAGYLLTSEGVVSTHTAFNTFQAASGGLYTKWATLDNALYLKTFGTSTSLTNPGGGYGGLGHRSGSTYWYWNGAAWASIDLAGAAGVPPGSDTQVIFNDAGVNGADAGLTYVKATDILTVTGGVVSGVFNATGTGASITFKNNNNNFSVDGAGNVSAAGSFNSTAAAPYKINGTTIFDSSINLTIGASSAITQGITTRLNSSGQFIGALFNASNTGASITFQNSNSNFSVDGNGNISSAGSINVTGANPYKVGGTTIVDSSRNATFVALTFGASSALVQGSTTRISTTGQGTFTDLTFGSSSSLIQGATTRINSSGGFVGSVFNAVSSGSSITFQNNNSSWSVNYAGAMSMTGDLNCTASYKTNGTTIVDSSRNASFATVTSAGAVVASIYDIAGGYFGQDATGGLVCGSRTLFFKGGILYAYT